MELHTADGKEWNKPIKTFQDMQEFVGGWVEIVKIGNGKIAFVNEEGINRQLPVNKTHIRFRGNVIVLDPNDKNDKKWLE